MFVPIITTAIVFLLAFTSTAIAAGAALPADGSVWDLAQPVWDAIMSGHGWQGAALALVFGVALARKYLVARIPFLASEAGTALLLLLGSFGGAMANSLAASGPNLDMVWKALNIAFVASGGFMIFKALVVVPLLRPLRDKAPGWLKPVLSALLWVFERPDVAKAGDDAVAANPPGGITGFVGSPKNVK